MLATPVIYAVPLEARNSYPLAELAGVLGAVRPDGTADLFLLVPGRPPEWVEKIPHGVGPGTFRGYDEPVVEHVAQT